MTFLTLVFVPNPYDALSSVEHTRRYTVFDYHCFCFFCPYNKRMGTETVNESQSKPSNGFRRLVI